MKKLIIINSKDSAERANFLKLNKELMQSDDVILIDGCADGAEFVRELNKHKGKFDTVFISSHGLDQVKGYNGGDPLMVVSEKNNMPITNIIATLNQDNEHSLREIHLASCHIGHNFNMIERNEVNTAYYQLMHQALKDGQVAVMHGDDKIGSFTTANARLKNTITKNADTLTNAILDSAETLQVISKKKEGGFDTFRYEPYGRENNAEISLEGLRDHLKKSVTEAARFESLISMRSNHDNVVDQLSEAQLKGYLQERFSLDITKITNNNEELGTFKKRWEKAMDAGLVDVNHVNSFGYNPLSLATIKGDSSVVEFLLEKKANPDARSPDNGETAMHDAVRKNYPDIIRVLKKFGANPNISSSKKKGRTPLLIAAGNGNNEAIEALMSYDTIDPNIKFEGGITPLMSALTNNNPTSAKLIASNTKTALEDVDSKGNTALIISASKGYDEVAQVLVARKANPDKLNNNGVSALIAAINAKQRNVVRTLAESEEIDPNIGIQGWTPLLLATSANDLNMMQSLLANKKTKPNIAEPAGFNPLLLAAQNSNKDAVELLLKDERTNKDFTLPEGRNAFFIAAEKVNPELMKLLVKYDVDVNLKDNKGWTALNNVLQSTSISSAAHVLQFKEVDINAATLNWTPIMFAVSGGKFEDTKTLLSRGANLNALKKHHNLVQNSSGKMKDLITNAVSDWIQEDLKEDVLKYFDPEQESSDYQAMCETREWNNWQNWQQENQNSLTNNNSNAMTPYQGQSNNMVSQSHGNESAIAAGVVGSLAAKFVLGKIANGAKPNKVKVTEVKRLDQKTIQKDITH